MNFLCILYNCYAALLRMPYHPSVSLLFWVAFSIQQNSNGAL